MQPSTLYQYSVLFEPEIEVPKAKFRMLHQHKDILGENLVFDGRMLFLSKSTGDQQLTSVYNHITYSINVTFVKDLPSDSPDVPLQLYNVLFNQILRILKLKPIGRQYFNPKAPVSIPQHKVELWPGYFTSINPNQAGVMLIADVAHKVLRTDTVADYLNEISRNRRGFKDTAQAQLIGQIVLTRYNNRTYRIDDIAWDKTPRSKFAKRTGEEITYSEYYSLVYNKQIRELEQPLLVHRHRRRGAEDEIIYLVPELCSMTGITDEMRSDFRVMKDISQHTRMNPAQRVRDLEKFLQDINNDKNVKEELAKWKLSIEPRSLEVDGQILGAETLFFKSEHFQIDANTADWTPHIKKSELLEAVSIDNWVLVFHTSLGRQAEDLYNHLRQVGEPIGIQMSRPHMAELREDSPRDYADAIRRSVSRESQMVVCVLPNTKKDRYDAIKHVCGVELALPSQCVVAKSLSKKQALLSVCNKIIQQINCKLGGQLWRMDIPLHRAMIVGIDVCHDTNRQGGRKSVVGFCASINSSHTKFYSRVTFQGTGQEIVDSIQACMIDALRNFYQINSHLPDSVFVYRDGVGDGMLQAVLDHEVPQFLDSFKAVADHYNPTLTVIVVKKRIHTRIFYAGESGRSQASNPPPGTVVDSACVHRGWYDFFLVSQYVRQGTVMPTHYHVVYDTSPLDPVHVQALTYKLCHLYYNWPGTIRTPNATLYAHKLAWIVGQSLHEDAHPSLRNKLHYL